ncbi:MAG: DUF2442 domain-containing protein [Kiritimatiellae bacterium]|nr:DUF2442 domain-containing protein [Kiritimatiellia bacterium]
MPTALHDVVSVQCLDGHLLRLRFDDGTENLFDMTPWLDRPPYQSLHNPALFNRARVEYGTVVWPNGLDIDPETLYP